MIFLNFMDIIIYDILKFYDFMDIKILEDFFIAIITL
jgi:hypothetical protein